MKKYKTKKFTQFILISPIYYFRHALDTYCVEEKKPVKHIT